MKKSFFGSAHAQLLLLACACSICHADFPDFMQIRTAYRLAPEGIGWDGGRSRFIIGSTAATKLTYFQESDVNVTSTGSLSEGVVSLHTLVEKSELLSSGGTVGLFVDDVNDRLWAGNTLFGAAWNSTYIAGISLVKLSTGAVQKNVDMTSLRNDATAGDRAMFVNDVVVADGNAYATNSYDRQIFKITPAGEATVFASNDLLAPATTTAFGLNGVVATGNYLLVGKSQKSSSALDVSSLYKVSLNDPKSVAEVTISGGVVRSGLDGMVWDNTKTYLYIVSNRASLVYTLKSDDEWKTATILKITTIPKQCVTPTTAAFIPSGGNKGVWVICAANFGGGPYAVQRVRGVPFPSSSAKAYTSCDCFIALLSLLFAFLA